MLALRAAFLDWFVEEWVREGGVREDGVLQILDIRFAEPAPLDWPGLKVKGTGRRTLLRASPRDRRGPVRACLMRGRPARRRV
jgi:hypothetical protein